MAADAMARRYASALPAAAEGGISSSGGRGAEPAGPTAACTQEDVQGAEAGAGEVPLGAGAAAAAAAASASATNWPREAATAWGVGRRAWSGKGRLHLPQGYLWVTQCGLGRRPSG